MSRLDAFQQDIKPGIEVHEHGIQANSFPKRSSTSIQATAVRGF
jgi:hypothetical protein